MKELLANFTIYSLYLIHFVSEEKTFFSDLCERLTFLQIQIMGHFLLTCVFQLLQLFLGTGYFFGMPVRET